jgi:polysaccharide pyruvyl transferase WcaK-like protein
MPEVNALKILLLGASFDTANMGVGALASGAMRCLLGYGRDTQVRLLDYGTEKIVHTVDSDGHALSIPVVCMRFSRKLYLGNNIAVLLLLTAVSRLLPTHNLRKSLLTKNRCLREICEADLVAAISGGDSFSDIYGLARFLYVSLPQLLVLLLGKKLVLLPQTLGPFSGWLARHIAQVILRRAAVVYSRDSSGVDQLKRLLGKNFDANRHRFCYDVGFLVEPRRPSKVEILGLDRSFGDNRPVIGLNISGLLWSGGYSSTNMFGLQLDYRRLIYEMIDHLITTKDAYILLIPHVFGQAGRENDVSPCQQIVRELGSEFNGRLGMVRGDLDQCEVKSVIGSCHFFIGSRMHACIAALSQEVPAVAIAYSDKFVGVLETLGVPTLVADARKLDIPQVLEKIDEAYDSRAAIASHLASTIPDVKKTVLNLCGNRPELQPLDIIAAAPVLSNL